MSNADVGGRGQGSPLQKRRMRVVGITLAVFICGFMVLALMSAGERNPKAMGAMDYLLAADNVAGVDPLNLVGRVAYLELTGVSDDGLIIGYASDRGCEDVSALVMLALQDDGWVVVDCSDAALLSLQYAGGDMAMGTNLLVQCMSVGQGSSFVLQRW